MNMLPLLTALMAQNSQAQQGQGNNLRGGNTNRGNNRGRGGNRNAGSTPAGAAQQRFQALSAIGLGQGLFAQYEATEWAFRAGRHAHPRPDTAVTDQHRILRTQMVLAHWAAKRGTTYAGLGTVAAGGQIIPPPAILTEELLAHVRSHITTVSLGGNPGGGNSSGALPEGTGLAPGLDLSAVLARPPAGAAGVTVVALAAGWTTTQVVDDLIAQGHLPFGTVPIVNLALPAFPEGLLATRLAWLRTAHYLDPEPAPAVPPVPGAGAGAPVGGAPPPVVGAPPPAVGVLAGGGLPRPAPAPAGGMPPLPALGAPAPVAIAFPVAAALEIARNARIAAAAAAAAVIVKQDARDVITAARDDLNAQITDVDRCNAFEVWLEAVGVSLIALPADAEFLALKASGDAVLGVYQLNKAIEEVTSGDPGAIQAMEDAKTAVVGGTGLDPAYGGDVATYTVLFHKFTLDAAAP
jgi:hypothetical protein